MIDIKATAILLLLCFFNSLAHSAGALCSPPRNVKVGYINGVMTTGPQYDVAYNTIRFRYGESLGGGAVVEYDEKFFYNATQGLGDFAETFEQRLLSQDASLANKFYLLFDALRGGGGYFGKLKEAIPELSQFFAALMEDAVTAKIADVLRTASNIVNAASIEGMTAARHRQGVDAAIASGAGLLIYAHSQGNLFAEKAYDYYLTKASSASVRVIHVAPASTNTRGPHVLADQDLVINGLRATGDVPSITNSIPLYGLRGIPVLEDDLLGHGLIEVYLNKNLSTNSDLTKMVQSAFVDLSGGKDCVAIKSVSCAIVVINNQQRIQWGISGAAYGRQVNSFVSPAPNASGVSDRTLSCSSWSGTTVVNEWGSRWKLCARLANEPAYTEWSVSALSDVSLGVYADLLWAPSNSPSVFQLMYLATHSLNVPSCPGTYTFN